MKTTRAFLFCLLLAAFAAAVESSMAMRLGPEDVSASDHPSVVTMEDLPDLRIVSVLINGPKATVEIANRCKADAPPSRLRLHLYKGNTKESGEVEISEYDVPLIGAGGKRKVFIELSKSGGGPHTFAGRYYRFEVDPLDKIKEAVEGNNWYEKNAAPFPDSADSCVLPPPPPANVLPDLRITKVTISGSRMYVEISNQCLGAAGANRLHLNLYSGATKASGGGEEMEADVPAIAGGSKTVVTFDLKEFGSKFSTFGDKYYRLDVDVYKKIKETIENNNWWEKNTIPFPDPANSCNSK